MVALVGKTVNLPVVYGGVGTTAQNRAWPAPNITGFSGTYGQGSVITLTGAFSNFRNGQLLYLTGNSAALGAQNTSLKAVDNSLPAATADSFKNDSTHSLIGSGAALAYQPNANSSGCSNAWFFLPAKTLEVFYSYNLWLEVDNWTESGHNNAMLKMDRVVSNATTDQSNPYYTIPFAKLDADTGSDSSASVYPDYPDIPLLNGSSRFKPEALFGKWTSHEVYVKTPPYYSAEQSGDYFQRTTKIAGADYRIGGANGAFSSTYYPPISDRETVNTGRYLHKIAMPYFKQSWLNARWWIDGLFVNDSYEATILGNASTLQACTKRFYQPQTSRTATSIVISCVTGNFVSADNIYAFVRNKDGSYTAGTLIRSGS